MTDKREWLCPRQRLLQTAAVDDTARAGNQSADHHGDPSGINRLPAVTDPANTDSDHDDDDDDDFGSCQSTVNTSSSTNLPNASSDCSALSTVSTITDRYGFIQLDNSTDDTQLDTDDNQQQQQPPPPSLPPHVLQRRELKWVHMLKHWDSFMARQYSLVRRRCRKGIPSAVRAQAWSHLCGGHHLLATNAGVYERLSDGHTVDTETRDQIARDLNRQFPRHEMFCAEHGAGQRQLWHVLCAYAGYRPGDGYCQAQAPLACLLLMHMPAALAFWCLVAVCDNYLPGYYGRSLDQVVLDGWVLQRLLRRAAPPVARLVRRHQLEPPLYMIDWFMCVYSRTLAWPCVLRVWDMFLCEGVRVLFAVGLVLLKWSLDPRHRRHHQLPQQQQQPSANSCDSLMQLLQRLRQLPAHLVSEEQLVASVLQLQLTGDEIETAYRRQLAAQRRQAKKRQKQEEKRQKQDEKRQKQDEKRQKQEENRLK